MGRYLLDGKAGNRYDPLAEALDRAIYVSIDASTHALLKEGAQAAGNMTLAQYTRQLLAEALAARRAFSDTPATS